MSKWILTLHLFFISGLFIFAVWNSTAIKPANNSIPPDLHDKGVLILDNTATKSFRVQNQKVILKIQRSHLHTTKKILCLNIFIEASKQQHCFNSVELKTLVFPSKKDYIKIRFNVTHKTTDVFAILQKKINPFNPVKIATKLIKFWIIISIVIIVFFLTKKKYRTSFFCSYKPNKFDTGTLFIVIYLISFLIEQANWIGAAGDEVEYLLIAKSMVADQDLNLYNNYLHNDLLKLNIPVLVPNPLPDPLYPVHQPGISLMIGIFFWLEKYLENINIVLSARLLMNLIWSLTVIQMFQLWTELKLFKSQAVCAILTILLCFSLPFLSYAGQLYPEVPAMGILFFTFRILAKTITRIDGRIIAVSILLSFLPWFHIKFIFLMIGFCFLLHLNKVQSTGRQWISPGSLAGFFLFPLLSVTSFLFYNKSFSTNISSSMDHRFASMHLNWQNFAGMIFDADFGILMLWPLFIVSIPGLYLVLKKTNRLAQISVLLVFILILIPNGLFDHWWLGFCPAGRYFLTLMPFLLTGSAYFISRQKEISLFQRIPGFLLFAFSLLNTIFFIKVPQLFYTNPDGDFTKSLWKFFGDNTQVPFESFVISWPFSSIQSSELTIILGLMAISFLSIYYTYYKKLK